MRLALLALLAPLLGACATNGGGSVAGGECKFLERPTYVVRGARQYDQDWIDSTIEGGVGACGWQRPAPRPSQMDAPVVKTPAKAAPAPKKPKHGMLWHMRDAWLKHKAAQSVEALAVPDAPDATPPVLPPLPAPVLRGTVDELLSPSPWSK